jgi:hypothetical protein
MALATIGGALGVFVAWIGVRALVTLAIVWEAVQLAS